MGRRTCLLHCVALSYLAFLSYTYALHSNVMTAPQSPVVEIGTNFTATCTIINSSEVTVEDLYWTFMQGKELPREQYVKINDSAISITIPITSTTPKWLVCKCIKSSLFVQMNPLSFTDGILFTKGYPPEKPENLTCISYISDPLLRDRTPDNLTCTWEPGHRGTGELESETEYTLKYAVIDSTNISVVAKDRRSAKIILEYYPYAMKIEIYVVAENRLARVESDHLIKDAVDFVKPFPPSEVSIFAEKTFATSLLVNWNHFISSVYIKLKYHIRYCAAGSGVWTEVPFADTEQYIQSFRLQYLSPDTEYVIQVRCRNIQDTGYWSDWSKNSTGRTAEDRPTSKPDLWRIIIPNADKTGRSAAIICKDPVQSNGRILSFSLKIQDGEWVNVTANGSTSDPGSFGRGYTVLGNFDLTEKKMVTDKFEVIAFNSVGKSPRAQMIISKQRQERAPVENLQWSTHGEQFWLEWDPPKAGLSRANVTEYVVEWVSLISGQVDWQREPANTTRTAIAGNLEKFKPYEISVYPVYRALTGKPATVTAYLQQGVPLKGPTVKMDKEGKTEVTLVWDEIPLVEQRGFITNYTIFYLSKGKYYSTTVSKDIRSYTLKALNASTKYTTWVMASTAAGSVNGTSHTFSTLKYAPREIEGIVVGVSLGFLFSMVIFMCLCFYKKDTIKKNFWPQIPDPGNSSIGVWSPDLPSKADTPKENILADVSVVEVDTFDGKSVFEEDKACLPLKKDKYLSEEHSSGIGGSSCMSSPRQSVSDSDEGGDSGQTTGSTVQYSSVVAANGYKGQTPGSLPAPPQQQHTFARSESTQPLLDSEENPEVPSGQEGSGHSQRFHRNPYFRHLPKNEDTACETELSQLGTGEQGGLASLRFSPLEEDSQQTTPTEEGLSQGWQPAGSVSSYRPQLNGYRPQ